jgi:U3 small nucleolar RNA-associated protein MPP10
MEAVPKILADSSKKFSGLVKKPERFLHQDEDLLESSKLLTKVVYDVSKLIEAEPCSKTLPELIIDGFDCEQVWAGVEMQNQQRFAAFQTAFARLELAALAECPLLLGELKAGQSLAVVEPEVEFGLEADEELEEEVEEDSPEAEHSGASDQEKEEVVKRDEDILNDPDFQNMSDSDGDDLPLFGDLSEDEQDDGEDEKGTFKERERKGGAGRVTEVDDQFFKLSDMEKFLDVEDKKEMREKVEDENDVDLFEEDADDDEQQVMYKEYFNEGDGKDEEEDEPDSDEEDDGADEAGEADNSNEDSDEAMDEKPSLKLLPSDDDESDSGVVRSSHEAEQERLARRVGRLEEAAVGAKPWQLVGEVAAGVRQENSLLAEHLDYDTAVRHAPVSTVD